MMSSEHQRFKDIVFLVIDDDPDSRLVAQLWLATAGARVLLANDGQAGLEMARRDKPDMVLSDLSMDVLDGWGFLSRLKADREIGHIPVIALTAHALESTKKATANAGFVGHIDKPIQPATFLDDLWLICQKAAVALEKPAQAGDLTRDTAQKPANQSAPQTESLQQIPDIQRKEPDND